MGIAVDRNRAAEHRRIAGVPPLPQAVTQHRDPGSPRPILFRPELAAQNRFDAQHRKEIGAHERPEQTLGLVAIGQRQGAPAFTGQVCERLGPLLEILHLGIRQAVALDAVGRVRSHQDHQFLGRLERQRPDDDGVDDAEDGAVDADPQRHAQDDDGRESGLLGDGPARVPDVLQQGFHGSQSISQ